MANTKKKTEENAQKPVVSDAEGTKKEEKQIKEASSPATKDQPAVETKTDKTSVEAEKETADKQTSVPQTRAGRQQSFDKQKAAAALESWKPRTSTGKLVLEGKITDITSILDKGLPVLEAEIVDKLIPNLESDLLLVGQSKGKFGGGQRRIFRQTQKKTREGNKPKFSTFAIVGNRNGFVGGGVGKSKETVPAREKALRNAKLNIVKVRRGCGSWQCSCKEAHSIPFAVTGKCGSSEITLMPAPKGKGLCIEPECGKIVALAGVRDIWSRTKGQTKTKLNLLWATFDALSKLSKMKLKEKSREHLNLTEGMVRSVDNEESVEGEE